MLKKLKRSLIAEKEDKSIFDIVIYGSAVKGKESPRDVDIAVIFLEGTLRQRLDKLQEIKSRLKKLIDMSRVDIKQILIKDLFSESFLAKTGILLEGISIFKDKKFCNVLGFESFTLFWYDLKNKNHSQKVKFNYILAGRNAPGILKELNGKRLVNSAIKIPIENSLIFENILKENNINYSKKNILEE